jgi:hypothetical protein
MMMMMKLQRAVNDLHRRNGDAPTHPLTATRRLMSSPMMRVHATFHTSWSLGLPATALFLHSSHQQSPARSFYYYFRFLLLPFALWHCDLAGWLAGWLAGCGAWTNTWLGR